MLTPLFLHEKLILQKVLDPNHLGVTVPNDVIRSGPSISPTPSKCVSWVQPLQNLSLTAPLARWDCKEILHRLCESKIEILQLIS